MLKIPSIFEVINPNLRMMKLKFLMLCMLSGVACLHAQSPVAKKYGDMITTTDLKEYLSIIASDAFEGRETGKRGQKIAAAFISAHFEELGLTPPVNGNFYQPVPLYTSIPGDIHIVVGNTTFDNFNDIVYYGTGNSAGELSSSAVFVGKGRKEDFDQVNVTDKAAVVEVESFAGFHEPMELAYQRGAKTVLVFNPDANQFHELVEQLKAYTSAGTLSLTKPSTNTQHSGVFFVAPSVAEKIFKTTLDKLKKAALEETKKSALKKLKPGALRFQIALETKAVNSENVLGYLEGTDKKDELVLVTAHYDHIGKGKNEGDQINNGADDDGSGTVSVLEIAKVFAQAKKDGVGPRRSMLFMTVTGEEKGLLGSDYYTQHPIFPLAKTVVDLNIDMVGRRDPQHKDSAPYVYVIGSDKLSTELHNLSERVNKESTNLIFDYTYNDQNHPDRLYYRSDHWNFAKNNIPIIFYFDGIHEDYHKPSDEVSKIEFDLLAKRAQCVFYTAWEIANRDQRILPDK